MLRFNKLPEARLERGRLADAGKVPQGSRWAQQLITPGNPKFSCPALLSPCLVSRNLFLGWGQLLGFGSICEICISSGFFSLHQIKNKIQASIMQSPFLGLFTGKLWSWCLGSYPGPAAACNCGTQGEGGSLSEIVSSTTKGDNKAYFKGVL